MNWRPGVEAIKEKLARVNDHARDMFADYPLPVRQHINRILTSRLRAVDRSVKAKYGTVKERKEIESLTHITVRDTGLLIQLGEKKHGVGRLDCQACAKQVVSIPDHPPELGIQTVLPRTSVCQKCKRGVVHVWQEEIWEPEISNTGALNPSQGSTPVKLLPTPQKTSVGAVNTPYGRITWESQSQNPPVNGKVLVIEHFHCDYCHTQTQTESA